MATQHYHLAAVRPAPFAWASRHRPARCPSLGACSSDTIGPLISKDDVHMPGPLEGIRVVDMGFWVAGPGAAGIMADWGAEVIKIEPPAGDPMRGMFLNAAGIDVPINPPFE